MPGKKSGNVEKSSRVMEREVPRTRRGASIINQGASGSQETSQGGGNNSEGLDISTRRREEYRDSEESLSNDDSDDSVLDSPEQVARGCGCKASFSGFFTS